MYKIVFLPTGEYLKPLLKHVENSFVSLSEAENAMKYRIMGPWWGQLNPENYYLNSTACRSSQDIQRYKYLFEIVEV